MRYFFSLLLTLRAWASVFPSTGSAGSATYDGTSTAGTVYTRGQNLIDTLAVVDCGDTINLAAGVEYRAGNFAESYISIPLRNTTLCNAGFPNWITITPVATTPVGVRVSNGNSSAMPIVSGAVASAMVLRIESLSHHFRFNNILFTVDPANNISGNAVNYLIADNKATVIGPGAYPHHIWFDRCLFRPPEYLAAASDPFRSVGLGVVIEGIEIKITNSSFYEFQGAYSGVPTHSISAITNAAAPVLTTDNVSGHPAHDPFNGYFYGATGNWARINGWNFGDPSDSTHFTIAKQSLLITVSGGNTAKFTSIYKRPHNLQVGDTVTISGVSFSGATGLNGTKTITAVPTPYEFEWTQVGIPNGTYCTGGSSCLHQDPSLRYLAMWDSTTAGSVTGTITWKEVIINVTAAVEMIAAPGPLRLLNNHIEGWFSGFFLGGGGSPGYKTATLSSCTGIGCVFSNIIGLRIGEIVAIKTIYVGNNSNTYRSVKISTITPGAGTTGAVTWIPWGINGLGTSAKSLTTGTCSTNGSTVTMTNAPLSGNYVGYQDYFAGVPALINGVSKIVDSIVNSSSFLTTTSIGTQSNIQCTLNEVPLDGGDARWDGVPGVSAEVRGNHFWVPAWGLPNTGVCKAMHEMKIADGVYIEGNTYDGDEPCIPIGMTQRNQGGGTPWSSLYGIRYHYNLVKNAERVAIYLIDDDLQTGARRDQTPTGANYGGGNNHWENNILMVANSETGQGHVAGVFTGLQTADSYSHNTIIIPTASAAFSSTGCDGQRTPPYGFMAGEIKNNIVQFGDSGFAFGTDPTSGNPCYPASATKAINNVLIDDHNKGSIFVNANAPNNLYAANAAAVGFTGTCDVTSNNYQNCGLSNSSPFKASGSDGLDPGALVLTVRDRTADGCTVSCTGGYSETANLLVWNDSTHELEITWTPLITTSKPIFTIFGSASGGEMHLYTDANRINEHADTATTSVLSRTGNTVVGDQITACFGCFVPLTPITQYWYVIKDGTRVMVGDFTTANGSPSITFGRVTTGTKGSSGTRTRIP